MDEEVEQWREIEGFILYEVSSFGRVRNRHSGNLLKPAKNQNGLLFVGLRAKGKTYIRSLAKLVAITFHGEQQVAPGVDPFNNVLHLDHDRTNCRASNLLLRPRWWVTKWEQEWRSGPYWHTPVIHGPTATIFETAWHAAHQYGMLEQSVLNQCVQNQNNPLHHNDWNFYAE